MSQVTIGEYRNRMNLAEIRYMIERRPVERELKYKEWLRLHTHWQKTVVNPHIEKTLHKISYLAKKYW